MLDRTAEFGHERTKGSEIRQSDIGTSLLDQKTADKLCRNTNVSGWILNEADDVIRKLPEKTCSAFSVP